MSDEMLRYPIGKFVFPDSVTPEKCREWINEIRDFPHNMREAVNGMNADQLGTVYRPGGWTLRQVVHHTADSHANAYIRFKLTLTEENPTIKPYLEALWAELPDGKSGPIEISLRMLEAIHARWVLLLELMPEEAFKRTYYHPESKRSYSLGDALANYAWHCQHHLAHITVTRKQNNW